MFPNEIVRSLNKDGVHRAMTSRDGRQTSSHSHDRELPLVFDMRQTHSNQHPCDLRQETCVSLSITGMAFVQSALVQIKMACSTSCCSGPTKMKREMTALGKQMEYHGRKVGAGLARLKLIGLGPPQINKIDSSTRAIGHKDSVERFASQSVGRNHATKMHNNIR